MAEIKGNVIGLKPNQKKTLQRLFQKRLAKADLISPELARSLTEISQETGRQVGVIVDRHGEVLEVLVGDAKGIMISELGRFRVGKSRFRGVRFLHTHLSNEALTKDDLTDLALLRFDAICAVETLPSGLPGRVYSAWLDPNSGSGSPWHLEEPIDIHRLDLDFFGLINALEQEFALKTSSAKKTEGQARRGILVGVTTGRLDVLQQSMKELNELAISAGVEVVDTVIQRRQSINPKFVVGSGKLKDLMITALQKGAELIVFEGELTGSQMRAIAELCELDVIDRTQLILDIFAKRAHSSDGKLQVELAQLKYSLPRLVLKDDFMSRITGGIGAKGPGETKMEVLRRRVKDRIAKLEKDLENISRQRRLRRSRRASSGLPVVNLVGYTNAGKSTIMKALTGADILVEDRLFATLDPVSRNLRLPEEGREVILTDTVGFIQDLPDDLAKAFKATLEELSDADILLHVVDVSNPNYADQIMAVEEVLEELALDSIPVLLIFNKTDRTCEELLEKALRRWPQAIPVSALSRRTLIPLLDGLANLTREKVQ